MLRVRLLVVFGVGRVVVALTRARAPGCAFGVGVAMLLPHCYTSSYAMGIDLFDSEYLQAICMCAEVDIVNVWMRLSKF